MDVLVLDTIHGGAEISAAYAESGNVSDAVDVYRGTTPATAGRALTRRYDLVAAPVHLDPDHPLLQARTEPVITHHEAVRRILGSHVPHPMIEITGARGKTTTAHALAHILPGPGILHTSSGTIAYPERTGLYRKSITPASLISAARSANRIRGWLVAETSLGVTGAGDLCLITSPEDYRIASGKKSALKEKIRSARNATCVLVAEGVPGAEDGFIRLMDIALRYRDRCTIVWEEEEKEFSSPLLLLPPYRTPLMLAAAAAVILGFDPSPLSGFTALPGRMSLSRAGSILIVDNANTGTSAETTICAARYARHSAGMPELTLVVGQSEGDGAVCEGFSAGQIAFAVESVEPDHLILVGPRPGTDIIPRTPDAVCPTLEDGIRAALQVTEKGSIVLAVKTWR